ncbi:DUF2165 domain-containing protein [Aliidiomarina halalkaliphila]|uniref:DUF2165 domain-containing protein n=1 Tax=Aliidiomarina halalkaliphila TaxID=2593535 RepID=A0A552X008_9GAMM|nr:DUF2165 family protein [Aliidiomarina halalkaliphila]TRW48400.1 DUF2165 domain-containing protein [Aliidiomarina halalkaliphila]
MALRLVKTILALFIGLMCVFYALQNVANINEAHFFMGYVLGNVGHEVYPNTFAFGVTSGAVAWVALTIVIALELLAGFLALIGAWKMWQARANDSMSFQAAKNTLYLGAGVALIVWFGLFTVIAGSFFQMWQTELGAGSLMGSFQYLGSIALVTLFIAMPDTE